MNIRLLAADQLTPELISAWDAIQRSEPTLESPYFRPEFTQVVAAVRNDVEIAVLEEAGMPMGFFPFERCGRNVGRPVGGRMSDFHGLIVRKGTVVELPRLLAACGLSAWHFDHLVADQESFRPYQWNTAPSPYIDLSQGWEAYRREQQTRHKEWFKQLARKHRQASREAGTLRLEPCSTNPDAFRSLVKWKTMQYQRTGVTNVLAFDWTVRLLERIAAARGEAFSGMVSALYMGKVLTAVLLSMRSFGVVHSWFSAYRPSFAPLSPGLALWCEVAQAFPELGVRRIDLGKGPETYKRHLMSGATELAEGSVDVRPVASLLRRGWHEAYEWARHSSLRRPLLTHGRMLRKMIEARSFGG